MILQTWAAGCQCYDLIWTENGHGSEDPHGELGGEAKDLLR
jgi:hypothetical protein